MLLTKLANWRGEITLDKFSLLLSTKNMYQSIRGRGGGGGHSWAQRKLSPLTPLNILLTINCPLLSLGFNGFND